MSEGERGPDIEIAFTLMSEVVRSGGALPLEDYQYQCAFREFPKAVKAHSSSLLDAIEASARLVPKKRRLTMHRSGTKEQIHAFVMDDIDSLLENVDTMLDEVKGQRQGADEQLEVAFGDTADDGKKPFATGRVVAKPQLVFDIPVDNSAEPFRPMLFSGKEGLLTRGKPHTHPFQELVSGFKFPETQLQPSADRPYMPLGECPLRLVDDDDSLNELATTLDSEIEFAVDLEHHDLHSYQGITCLMQISTRTEDFIIDVLRLRSKMHRLNSSFLNPKILKVFHGANEDVRWLQKDFGIYVANMFDTGIALQMLHMPHGLAFAVDHFCQVRLDKRFQTADWRIRPLPREMVQYARQDTHYLLYCYDRLKALLLNSEARASTGNLFVHTLQESRRLCLTLYEKPMLDPQTSYLDAMGKSLGGLSQVQLSVIRDVFNWRDEVARAADESPMVIMHTSAILQIGLRLPTAVSDLLKALPSPVSSWVRKDAAVIVQIIKQAFTDNGVTDEALHRTSASAGEAGSSYQRAAERHLHVAGTGTLPSLDVGGVLEFPPEFAFSPKVSKLIQPSPWFTCTLNYLHRTAAAVPKVPLPGADIVIRKALSSAPAVAEDGDNSSQSKSQDKNTSEGDQSDEEDEENEGEEEEKGTSAEMPFGVNSDLVRVARAPLPVGQSVQECFGLRGRPKGATFKRMDTGKRSRSGNVKKAKGKK
jgi:exosome complex exonuclease RRP6